MSDPIFMKTYVRPDNTAVLTCPQCGCQKTVLVESFKEHKHKLKIKCKCQNVFNVFLEYRDRGRRKAYLKGTYINHSRDDSSGEFITQDISVTGIAFSSLDIKDFKEGDKISIELTLDDGRQTEIRKNAVVKGVRRSVISCEFEKTADLSDTHLANYTNLK